MAKPITIHGMSQEDLVRAVVALGHALKDLAAKLDGDGGVTDTNYAATVALYYTVIANTSIQDLGKA